jgi:hypothetical protein
MSPEAEGWRRAGARAERSAPTAESAGLRRRKAHEHVRAARRQDPGAAGRTELLLFLAGVGVEVGPSGEDAARDSQEEHRFIV